MKRTPKISAARAAEVFKEMLECRRIYCADGEFFKMSAFLDWLCGDGSRWSIRAFHDHKTEDYKRRAGVIEFEDRVKITVDEKLMTNARNGCWFSNFILAHEVGHLALGHHSMNAVTKNFQLFQGPNGSSNIPPTDEELEANYAAVFLQCGITLFDKNISPSDLARRAFSDFGYVRKAMQIVQVPAFQEEYNKIMQPRTRVVL